jgi:hypothetical protein
MSQRWLPVGALFVSVLLLGFSAPVGLLKPDTTKRVAAVTSSSSPPDTLRSSTTAGTPLIRSLPAERNGAAVSRYLILDGPALSGVAGRSFTWIPRGAEPGTYDVRLQAQHMDAPADTLVLRITVES